MGDTGRKPIKAVRTGAPASPAAGLGKGDPTRTWTFLTNHGHVLLCLAQRESMTDRELGLQIGITERSVQGILADLIADGYLDKAKVGRRNRYAVNPRGRMRHPLEATHTVGELIKAMT